MTYDHDVKVNGKWYKAGDVIETPLSALVTAKVEQTKTVDEEKVVKKTTTKRSTTKRK